MGAIPPPMPAVPSRTPPNREPLQEEVNRIYYESKSIWELQKMVRNLASVPLIGKRYLMQEWDKRTLLCPLGAHAERDMNRE